MADTEYHYVISTAFPDGKVSIDRLQQEIRNDPGITIALARIDTDEAADDCNIVFKDPLNGEKPALDAIVAAHSGIPFATQPAIDNRTGAQDVKVVSRTATYGRTAFVGASIDIPAATTKAKLLRFPFQIDLVEGFLLNEKAVKAALGDDVASFEIAPRTDVGAVFGAALAAPIAIGQKQVTFVPAVLAAMVSVALLDVGFFRVEVEEGATKEAVVILVTDYDDALGGGTGVVQLGTFNTWDEGGVEPVWAGFANAYTVAAKVYMTRLAIHAVNIIGDGAIKFGSYGLDSAPIAANVLLRLPYTNTDAAAAKTMRIVLHVQTGKPLPL